MIGIITGTLTTRKANDDPPSYRVVFDDGTERPQVRAVLGLICATRNARAG